MGGKNLHQASTVKPPKDEDVSDDDIKVRKVDEMSRMCNPISVHQVTI